MNRQEQARHGFNGYSRQGKEAVRTEDSTRATQPRAT